MKNQNTKRYSTPIRLKMPVDWEKIIEISDPVSAFNEVMDHMDLNQYIAEKKDCNTGRPKYDPIKLLKVILFAFMENGDCSVRMIRKLCTTDIRFLWLPAFVLGSLLGGVLAGLPFEMVGFTGRQLTLCILCKLLLAPVFVAPVLCMSVIARDKAWLSFLLAVMVGMFLFMMIGMLTPLDAGVAQVGLCLAGSALFGVGLGAVSRLILTKRDLL